MKSRSPWLLLGLLVAAGAALATGPRVLRADLSGDEEVPAVFTTGKGDLRLLVYPGRNTIAYELTYSGLTAPVTQAHIHFGQPAVNGAISAFLCTNLGNGPTGTQPCPNSGTISGVITADQVVASAAAQGIAAGDIDALIDVLREQLTYVNVHSTRFPGGEIRGQIGHHRGGHHH
ncbi:MAG TPA: CHRD domain-containing protein [Burkholderiaceae bacterium]